jgi:hypothetical protein
MQERLIANDRHFNLEHTVSSYLFFYDVHDNLNYILITVKKYIEKYFCNLYRSEHTTIVFNSLLLIMEVIDSLMLPQALPAYGHYPEQAHSSLSVSHDCNIFYRTRL